MKKILKQGVYRTKCPYCDCEFEYEREDVEDIVTKLVTNPIEVYKMVRCPSCKNLIGHSSGVRSKIETAFL